MHEGDMRSFRLNQKFPLVMIPFRPMQHMFTVEDQVAALKTAAAHLTDTGILAFDVFYPKFDMIWSSVGKKSQRCSGVRLPIRRRSCTVSFAKMRSTRSIRFSASRSSSAPTSGDALILEETEAFRLCYYTYPHLARPVPSRRLGASRRIRLLRQNSARQHRRTDDLPAAQMQPLDEESRAHAGQSGFGFAGTRASEPSVERSFDPAFSHVEPQRLRWLHAKSFRTPSVSLP